MLNKMGTRELTYLVRVDSVEPIPNYDRVELAHIGGWTCIVPKGQFEADSIGVYFEIDSRVPADNPAFAFLEKRHYKIKTLKMCGVCSHGLLMALSDFTDEFGRIPSWVASINLALASGIDILNSESRFLTKELGVIYADDEDNKRKANTDPNAKYMSMKARHKKIFKNPFVKKMMKHKWFRELMFFFFGKKKDKPNAWPSHIAAKTDVERVQNMMFVLRDKQPYVASEKVDGSSMTVACEKLRNGKLKYYVCSRNVVFLAPDQKCYYDTNIYTEMYEKYNIKEIITNILNDYNLPNVAIQCEVYGDKVQRRDYSLTNGEHRIAVFHIVSNGVKFPMDETIEICEKYGLPHVPIVDDNYILPDTIEELQAFAESAPSAIDGKEREGIVFYDKKSGQQYFKMVSPNYLLKYHG